MVEDDHGPPPSKNCVPSSLVVNDVTDNIADRAEEVQGDRSYGDTPTNYLPISQGRLADNITHAQYTHFYYSATA